MNNNLNNKENILIKTDQNNLIYIDPNSVISNDGKVSKRSINQEELIMYVNLEADLIPRSSLILGNEQNKLSSVAKGIFNVLHNKNGKNLDTSWTETYTPKYLSENGNYSDDSGQSFGIDNIDINVSGINAVPSVNIKFTDVRGKTLFESPENSPYKSFFHIPWPIFYLTVKGYYGKAIRYRLHLIDFKSKFNSQNGNYEINTKFVGSTYAYLNDIPLKGILNAPYMFAIENEETSGFNEKTGTKTKTIKKSSRGYKTLISVYNEYKNKGLIDKNFPVKTLREIIISAGRLDKILEQDLFEKVIDPLVLSELNSYEKLITDLGKSVESWKSLNLSPEYETKNNKTWNKLSEKHKNKLDIINGDKNSLKSILEGYVNKLNNNKAFGKSPLNTKKFEKSNVSKSLKTISITKITNIGLFYDTINGSVCVNMVNLNNSNNNGLLDEIYNIQREFVEKRRTIEKVIEEEMNNIVSGKIKNNNSFGFEPTIRNIVAVICANADTYVRLLKDIHQKAFDVGNERKKIISSFDTDAPTKDDNIYPWPEIKKQSADGKINVLVYPGDFDISNKLKSFNSLLWPEVDFVENYLQVSTYKSDPLTEKELDPDAVSYIFENTSGNQIIKNINLFSNVSSVTPYINKSLTSLVYEIYERAKYTTSTIPYDNNSINELANIEFENIENSLINDDDLFSLLKRSITNSKYDGADNPFIFNLVNTMGGLSIYERYPYFKSQLPTTDYIKNIVETDFSVTKSTNDTQKTEYKSVNNFLKNYIPETYRLSIYPFNSKTYLGYSNKNKLLESDLKLNNSILTTTNTINNFISSDIEAKMWIKPSFNNEFTKTQTGSNIKNLFSNNLLLPDGREVNILNTPYFHKQLFKDFSNGKSIGKYVGSAYLLLNSLPFLDFNEKIYTSDKDTNGTILSTLLREISSTHKIPYHLIIKWGSIYHRYKKYLTEGVDIIDNVTEPIDVNLFYDTNLNRQYTGNTEGVTWVSNINDKNIIGFLPNYQNIFSNIVNGFIPYDITSVYTTGYTISVNNKNILTYVVNNSNSSTKSYTSFIDNSKNNTTNKTYTLLPSNGYKTISGNSFDTEIQNNLRIIWDKNNENNNVANTFTGFTFPIYNEYFNNTGSTVYTLSQNYKKVVDLISMFKSDILDVFEQLFIEFSTEYINTEIEYSTLNVKFNNFQKLLQEITTVQKNDLEEVNLSGLIKSIIERQNSKLNEITKDIISNDNLIDLTLLNPREINDFIIGSFTKESEIITDFGVYKPEQLNDDTIKLIKLYVGDYIDNGTNYYQSFFNDFNISLTEENIKLFRPLLFIYAGYKNSDITIDFKTYVKNNITKNNSLYVKDEKGKSFEYLKINDRLLLFLNTLITKISTKKLTNSNQTLNIKRSHNDEVLKLELYNYFKSFNDKWVAGNSIGQKTILEEILFLDKANKDIGDQVYIDMSKLIPIANSKNHNLNLYTTLVLLLDNSGFDMRSLPAYVNWYGIRGNKNFKPSKNVAKNIFGTFLEVDVEDSTPKIILQYFGPSSKHLELSDIDKNSKFKGDGFDASNPNNNPIVIAPDVFRNIDYSKSNRAIVFEVNFGDQNQNMFKSFDVDQSTIRNTSESFEVTERLGNSAAGSQTAQVDVGLFDYYRQASYQCNITSMGNMMIQPTMFFYLKNVPMFRGTYWISEVSHRISLDGIQTNFKGSRIPIQSLPDPKDSFMASYRSLFDKMLRKATNKVKSKENNPLSTEKEILTDLGTYYYDTSGITVNGEVNNGELVNLVKSAGITEQGIPYNGYNNDKFIQKIKIKNESWLRGIAVTMGGEKYNIEDSIVMSIVSRIDDYENITWGQMKESNQKFYCARFNINPNNLLPNLKSTNFYSPRTGKKVTLNTNINQGQNKYEGPIHHGPSLTMGGYGIGLSKSLMKELGIKDNDVIYFNFN